MVVLRRKLGGGGGRSATGGGGCLARENALVFATIAAVVLGTVAGVVVRLILFSSASGSSPAALSPEALVYIAFPGEILMHMLKVCRYESQKGLRGLI